MSIDDSLGFHLKEILVQWKQLGTLLKLFRCLLNRGQKSTGVCDFFRFENLVLDLHYFLLSQVKGEVSQKMPQITKLPPSQRRNDLVLEGYGLLYRIQVVL
jgi:hypothetical protein